MTATNIQTGIIYFKSPNAGYVLYSFTRNMDFYIGYTTQQIMGKGHGDKKFYTLKEAISGEGHHSTEYVNCLWISETVLRKSQDTICNFTTLLKS